MRLRNCRRARQARYRGCVAGATVNVEIARVRDVPEGRTVVSPPCHRAFSTPRELVRFIARMRELSGAVAAGFKLSPGSRRQHLAVCTAMIEEGTAPDCSFADGAEGGTGTTPLEFAGHVGIPITEGLMTVHNALVGAGLWDRNGIGASGEIVTETDLVERLIQGADYGSAAHAMTFAVGCIQAQDCHTDTCPWASLSRTRGGPACWTSAARPRGCTLSRRPPPAAHCRSWHP